MTAYFIRRFLLIIPTFLGITIMVFIVTRFVPGGPIERIIAEAQQMQSMEGGRTSGPSSAEQSQPLSTEQIRGSAAAATAMEAPSLEERRGNSWSLARSQRFSVCALSFDFLRIAGRNRRHQLLCIGMLGISIELLGSFQLHDMTASILA